MWGYVSVAFLILMQHEEKGFAGNITESSRCGFALLRGCILGPAKAGNLIAALWIKVLQEQGAWKHGTGTLIFLRMWVAHLFIFIFSFGVHLCLYALCTTAGVMFEFPKLTFMRLKRAEPGIVGKSISQAWDSLHAGFFYDHFPVSKSLLETPVEAHTLGHTHCSFSFLLGANRWW